MYVPLLQAIVNASPHDTWWIFSSIRAFTTHGDESCDSVPSCPNVLHPLVIHLPDTDQK